LAAAGGFAAESAAMQQRASLRLAHWILALARWRLFQPIPEVLAYRSEDMPGLHFLAKAHGNAQRHYAGWIAGEIALGGYRNHTEIDMLHAVRIVNQVNSDHIPSPVSVDAQRRLPDTHKNFLVLNLLVHLLAMYRYFYGSFDAQSHGAALDMQHRNHDVTVDDDALTQLPAQN
jgi:hypothetical protein